MNSYKLDLEKYAALARQAVAEGCVLLENEGQALPLRDGERVAVFGRMAFHYYKSGLGSGGLVNTRYVVGILDALKECEGVYLDEKLMGIYEDWIMENPYDEGQGWGHVPWCQKEMDVTEEMLDCARRNDVSLVVIGRTAGEDQDNNAKAGSYCLTETEEDMIRRVCEVSERTVVVLNVGNIIDMSWVEKYRPQAVLYVWQGGQEILSCLFLIETIPVSLPSPFGKVCLFPDGNIVSEKSDKLSEVMPCPLDATFSKGYV